MTHQLLDAVHTRACTGIKKAHNSVTVQNRTHVYMNFFDHKNLGNYLLQLCPKVVKHPVYAMSGCAERLAPFGLLISYIMLITRALP